MSLKAKQAIIAVLGLAFLVSLIFVQYTEVARKRQEAGLAVRPVSVPLSSERCYECHKNTTPGIIDHWVGSTHAEKGVGCVECHQAETNDADAFNHYDYTIATIVTPRDCSKCHPKEAEEFANSHHAKGGNILASLDNLLAETVEGHRAPFNPHSPTPGRDDIKMVNGMASAETGCKQCHGSKIALEGKDGKLITLDDLKPDDKGKPTNVAAVSNIKRDANLKPVLHSTTWPNTGIGRLNLDGSRGSCSACHSRHDFSPRRARQPENCGKCHLGPDHPQKEIYEESKHGVAYRDLHAKMNLDGETWILGKDYSQAPTCATCHMSGHSRNNGRVTHDPGERISWTNRPPISLLMDTDANHAVVKEADPSKRAALIKSTWQEKRLAMRQVCTHCHTEPYVDAFYKQYDDFVVNYNEKFAKPGTKIISALRDAKLITPQEFDEEIEWTWFYLWHHEGRRARHGASMMAPDYAHWHGMYEVAERFYMQLIPQARELAEHAEKDGKGDAATAVRKVIDDILARPEHQWFESQLKPQGEAAASPPAGDASPAKVPDADDAATPPGGDAAADKPKGD
ncbi:MAG: hydroxylamine oxidoreductase [Planctomycetota bacterium]|nr:MAG: hydroxylamine oxidoreductase [Planctomycetota bacterium]